MSTYKDVTYECKCSHSQVIRFDLDENPLPVTNCVKCRAGFGIELNDQMMLRKGMFPTGELVSA